MFSKSFCKRQRAISLEIIVKTVCVSGGMDKGVISNLYDYNITVKLNTEL